MATKKLDELRARHNDARRYLDKTTADLEAETRRIVQRQRDVWGSALLALHQHDKKAAAKMMGVLGEYVRRPADRHIVGLPVKSSKGKQEEAPKGSDAAPPSDGSSVGQAG